MNRLPENSRIILHRISSSDLGTRGELLYGTTWLCHTLEPATPVTPKGSYACQPHNGPEWKNVWELENVPGHSGILIHSGNTAADTKGCVLVGLTASDVGVAQSRAALAYLRDILPSHFTLEVR